MIEIVEANIEHANLIAEIGRKAFLESHGHSASKENIDGFILKNYSKATISKELSDPQFLYHIIYFNNSPAGFSKMELNRPNQNIKEKNLATLDRIYFLKEFYGKNLGSKLLEFNIELAKQKAHAGIWLAVWVENQRAVKFYTKTGFKIVGKYDFIISEDHSNPNHIMHLKF